MMMNARHTIRVPASPIPSELKGREVSPIAPHYQAGCGVSIQPEERRESSTFLRATDGVRPMDDQSPPVVLTVDELAILLRIERKTAYAAIANGEIPGVCRVGRSIRILRQAVLDWLGQGQVRVSRSRRSR